MGRHIFHQGQLKWTLSWGEIKGQVGSRRGHLHPQRVWTWLVEALSSSVWPHSWDCSGQGADWRLPWSLPAWTAWWSYQHEGEKCLTDSVSCSFPFPQDNTPSCWHWQVIRVPWGWETYKETTRSQVPLEDCTCTGLCDFCVVQEELELRKINTLPAFRCIH